MATFVGHKKTVAEEPVTSVLTDGEVLIYERELTADEEVLAALGYKPEFKREFSLWVCISGRGPQCLQYINKARLTIWPSDNLLCFLCRPRPAPFLRRNTLLWDGLRWDGWYGLGLVDCYGLHPMRCSESGYHRLLYHGIRC